MKKRTQRLRRSKQKRSTPKKKYDLYNGDQWDNYRLGDVIYGHLICYTHVCLQKTIRNKSLLKQLCEHLEFDLDKDTEQENKDWCKKKTDNWADRSDTTKGYLDTLPVNYPNSIAHQYLQKVGYPDNYRVYDKRVIRSILKSLPYDKPKRDALVIHLRLGDVLSKKYADEGYVYTFDHYTSLLRKVKRNKSIQRVDIVTGLHKRKFVKKSNDYLQTIIELFETSYPVKVVLTKNPDKDYYYMCHAKYFARSGGGFSNLVVDYLKGSKSTVYT